MKNEKRVARNSPSGRDQIHVDVKRKEGKKNANVQNKRKTNEKEKGSLNESD